MKILVTGGSGVVGSNFISFFSQYQEGHIIYSPTRTTLDITNKKNVEDYFKKYSPDVVIHFAAHRDAGSAEEERGDVKGSVWKINVNGTKNVVKSSLKYNSFLIHISTDFVFPGNDKHKGPYAEDEKHKVKLNGLSWYGYTKKKAEEAVIKAGFTVIRIGNVIVNSKDPKADYLGKILWLYDNKKIYPMFNDQYTTLSYIPEMAELINRIIKKKSHGTYHVASTNVFTPYDLATYLLQKARGVSDVVKATSIKQYLTDYPFRYPQHGGLQVKLTSKKHKMKFVTWQENVDKYIQSMLKSK